MKNNKEIVHKAPAKVSRPRETIRYLNNAKDILKSIPVEDNIYKDVKPVREAFGTAYLAILEAINEHLINKKGFTKKELPKSVDSYRAALQKHIAIQNGKLMREFENLYDALHIAGYYRGLIYDTRAVKDYFKAAKEFIDKITQQAGLAKAGKAEVTKIRG